MQKNTVFIFLLFAGLVQAQVDKNDELQHILQSKDRLLFNAAFSTCDTLELEKLISDNCEFYHDQSGKMDSKAAFIGNVKNGLCKMNPRPSRVLIEESLETFPLYNNGELYGAIQTGKHQFYMQMEQGQDAQLTSTALFTHVWVLNEGHWQLDKVLSYDHQPPGDK